MNIRALTSTYLRQTYLRGIDLGPSWFGPSSEAVIAQSLQLQLILAENLTGLLLRAQRVRTLPAPSLTLGTEYEILGNVLPYHALLPPATSYLLALPFPPVCAVEQVRLWQGGSTFETVPIAEVTWTDVDGVVTIPGTAMLAPSAGLGWAIDYTTGIGQIPIEIVQWVCLRVAMGILSMDGISKTDGMEQSSLTMDGITDAVTYGGRNGAGIYGSMIQQYQALLDMIDLSCVRWRYQGVKFPTG